MKNYKSRRPLTLAVLLTLALPTIALAAENGTAKSRDIIVTANKTAAEVTAVPQAVEVITADDIEKLGASDVLSALRTANNLNLSSAGITGNQVSIRGNSTNHTLILVDGKRLSGEDTDVTQNVYALSRLNIHNVERIEIVRGNASVLYGSDALGGVINIITKTPTKNAFAVGITTGTKEMTNYYHSELTDGNHLSGTFDVNFSKARSFAPVGDSNMYGPRQFFDLKTIYDFKNANHNKLKLGINYFKEHLKEDYENKTGAMPAIAGKYTSLNKKEYFDSKGYGVDLAYGGKDSKNNWEYRFYYNKLDKNTHYNNERADLGSNIFNAMYPAYDYDVMNFKNYVLEAHDTIYADDNHTFTFGGEYRNTNYEGTRLGGSSSSSVNKTIESHGYNTYALYAEDQWQANDKWLFIPSTRYEHNSMFGSNIVGKIGTTYSADKNNRLKMTFGRGYKAPTVSELYLNMNRNMGVANYTIYGNPELKPEKSLNFDLSYESEFGSAWSKVSYYHNKISNLINTEQIYQNGNTTHHKYYNVDKARIQGYEFELGTKLGNKWTLKANTNLISAKNGLTGAQLNNRARFKTTFSLNYDDTANTGFSASLWEDVVRDYRYQVQGLNTPPKDYDYSTLNLTMRQEFANGFSMTAGLDNIFNQRKYDIYMYGRVWRLGAEWKF